MQNLLLKFNRPNTGALAEAVLKVADFGLARVSAEANLVTRENFPPNATNPGRSLVSLKIIDVAQVMVRVKALSHATHAVYVYQAPKLKQAENYNIGGEKRRRGQDGGM